MKHAQHPRTGSATSIKEHLRALRAAVGPCKDGSKRKMHGVCTGRGLGRGTGRFSLGWEPCRRGGGGRHSSASLWLV